MNASPQVYYNNPQQGSWDRGAEQGGRNFSGQQVAAGFGAGSMPGGFGQQNGFTSPTVAPYNPQPQYQQNGVKPNYCNGSNGHQQSYYPQQIGYQNGHQAPQQYYGGAPNYGAKSYNNHGGYQQKPISPSQSAVDHQAASGDWVNQANGSDSAEKNLFSRVNSGINFDNYETIPVQVTGGEDCPAPPAIAAFADAGLHQWVQANVEKSGYVKPTPVQKNSIPTLMGNRDLMSCAQTGSGKTAAFLLPIINHILVDGPEALRPSEMNSSGRRTNFPAALVLSPTRELAIQIHKEAAKFSYRTNLVTAILYGGRENYRDQINRLRAGCHILIATPGRLIDILEQGYIGLAGCRYLVLDEADRMLDMGFEPQIRKIVAQGMPAKTSRVTAMFSATFPKEIQVLAQDFLKPNYVFLTVGRVGSTSENIEQQVLWVEELDKRKALMQILEIEDPTSLVLVFVETKRGANELAYFLTRQQIRAVAIHGDLKQFERERNLEYFRNGQNTVLVATAVAARGLDIPNVRHVVNYDLPGDVDEYVHRIGRTGRCGNTGKATSFFNDKNRPIGRELSTLIAETNREVPEWLQRVAAEGRTVGSRQMNKQRFGATDHRRGGGYAGGMSRGGGATSNGGYAAQSMSQNSYNGGGMQNGYAGFNGYPQQQQTRGYQSHNGYQGQSSFGAFGSSNGGFGGTVTRGGFGGMMGQPMGFNPAAAGGPARPFAGNWQPRN